MRFVSKYVSGAESTTGFELLYHRSVDRMVRQVYLVTANRERARQAVHRAFGRAAGDWPGIESDPSPEGWVRAQAFDLALSPWRPGGPREMHGIAIREFLDSTRLHALTYRLERRLAPVEPGLTGEDRMLLGALLRLPRQYRRALVLHDALGLTWAQTAQEVEATTAATCGRVIRSRALLALRLPTLLGADWRSPRFAPALGARLRAAASRGCPNEVPHTPLAQVRRAGRVQSWLPTAAAAATVAATAALFAASWPPPPPHIPIAEAVHLRQQPAESGPSYAFPLPVSRPCHPSTSTPLTTRPGPADCTPHRTATSPVLEWPPPTTH